ncbi:hypothetical protein L1987_47849 [Smallanthus sonchifolius]|uniref:Uncharacterized protein n=1 Tax=Smallanthus sonchifolius TaxID=185202 RepID=A0ACB9FPX3_9ASTR|nr:hypothetical protein L1987_47849 [Smallanthus sonchifolius]
MVNRCKFKNCHLITQSDGFPNHRCVNGDCTYYENSSLLLAKRGELAIANGDGSLPCLVTFKSHRHCEWRCLSSSPLAMVRSPIMYKLTAFPADKRLTGLRDGSGKGPHVKLFRDLPPM